MIVDIDSKDVKSGVLGLVVALVEIIQETLRIQAMKRMEGGSLSEAEIERLGAALMDLEDVLERIKVELGIREAVQAVRDGLDRIVQETIDSIWRPDVAGTPACG